MPQTKTANEIVIDTLVAAYNAQDARAFADLFALDAVHGLLHGNALEKSREEIYQRYIEVFAMYPGNRTEVVHRIVFGNYVIDHERVTRSKGAEPFDVVAINTLEAGLIKRLEFVRA